MNDTRSDSMKAYDDAQELLLAGEAFDDVTFALTRKYPNVGAQGMVPTIVRQAARDLTRV